MLGAFNNTPVLLQNTEKLNRWIETRVYLLELPECNTDRSDNLDGASKLERFNLANGVQSRQLLTTGSDFLFCIKGIDDSRSWVTKGKPLNTMSEIIIWKWIWMGIVSTSIGIRIKVQKNSKIPLKGAKNAYKITNLSRNVFSS